MERYENGRGPGKLNTLNYHKIWQRKQNSEWILGGEQFRKQVLECVLRMCRYEYTDLDIYIYFRS